MARLVGYARVSSEAQRDNTSLAVQQEAIERYCEQNGHVLAAWYQDVESGETIDRREGFCWALTTVSESADGLLVYRLDRLTRSVFDAERLKMTFIKQNKMLLSVFDNIDLKSDDGELVFTISAAIAQLERKRLNTRCQVGRKKKQADGGYIGGRPAFGYASYRKTLIEVPHEQAIIQMIRQLYKDSWPPAQIARHLNQTGIPSKTRSAWSVATIQRILAGDPPNIVKLRASGQLLSADAWHENFENEPGVIPESCFVSRSRRPSELAADDEHILDAEIVS